MKRQAQPIVAIIGRPNVGKSTLFNRIIGRRKAGVHDMPGLTRDRNYATAEWGAKTFLLIDTGGYDPTDTDIFTSRIREQVLMAVEEADSIIFLADVGVTDNPIDHKIADILRRCGKPFLLAVNKCDNPALRNEAYSFAAFGVERIYPISATHGIGIGDLLDAATEPLAPESDTATDVSDEIHIAIVGRRNVGKSTLVNEILGTERVITSPVAGTTRDAIDTPFTLGDKRYVIIDTAGIRRRGKIKRGPEHLSVTSSIMSIHRCDVAILLIDAATGVIAQDTHIGGYIHDSGRACILAVNKWDRVEKDTSTAGAFAKKLREDFNFLSFAPIVFISALTGQRVRKIFDIIAEIMPQYHHRIETVELNNALERIVRYREPPTHKGRRLKIKYATQTGVAPPTFTLFVNNPTLLHFSYRRYLVNQLRRAFNLTNTPIRIKLRRKSRK